MYACRVTEPRRVLIGWDHGAHGIRWVLAKEEKEAPAPPLERYPAIKLA